MENLERKLYEPRTSIKNWETEAPLSNMNFKRDYKTFDDAWNAGVGTLIKSTEKHLVRRPNVRLAIGITFTVLKQAIDYEDQDPDDTRLKQISEHLTLHSRTKLVTVYIVDTVKPTILTMNIELEKQLHNKHT